MRCINGAQTYYGNCIGFCNSFSHKGFLTENLEHQHGCFAKNCKSFRPLTQNPYWINKKRMDELKEERKKQRKEKKDLEKLILENAPNNSKPIFCKHLYDNTFILLLKEYNRIPYKYYKNMFDVNVYIKHVPEEERNNIDVSFLRFLPDEMRQIYLQKKNDPKKNGRV